jgi:hypothetical protein
MGRGVLAVWDAGSVEYSGTANLKTEFCLGRTVWAM